MGVDNRFEVDLAVTYLRLQHWRHPRSSSEVALSHAE